MVSSDISRMMDGLKRKIFLLVGRGILTNLTKSGKVQTVQVTALKDETISDMERMQPYGLETYPKVHNTSEATLLFINGNRDQGIVINILDRTYRPKDLSEGEVCLFDFNDSRIWLKQSGNVYIKAKNYLLIEDKDGNKMESSSTGWKITDKNGNVIESNATQWKINDNLTVDK